MQAEQEDNADADGNTPFTCQHQGQWMTLCYDRFYIGQVLNVMSADVAETIPGEDSRQKQLLLVVTKGGCGKSESLLCLLLGLMFGQHLNSKVEHIWQVPDVDSISASYGSIKNLH